MEESKQQSRIQLSFGDSVPGIETIDERLIIFKSVNEIFPSEHPLRVDIAMLVLCRGGRLKTALNLKEYELTANSMLVAMPDQIIQQHERSSDFSGIFIGVSRSLINEVIPFMGNMLPTFLFIQEHPLSFLDEDEVTRIEHYYEFLSDRVADKSNIYHKQITYHLLSSLFYETFNIIGNHHRQHASGKNKQESILEQFLALVHTYFMEQRSVAFYAKQMNLTSKYISQTIKTISGKTAGEWIDLFVILEAKVQLRSTDDSIQEIAYRLNFPNQSFFGKYFKQHTGFSPKEYRKIK